MCTSGSTLEYFSSSRQEINKVVITEVMSWPVHMCSRLCSCKFTCVYLENCNTVMLNHHTHVKCKTPECILCKVLHLCIQWHLIYCWSILAHPWVIWVSAWVLLSTDLLIVAYSKINPPSYCKYGSKKLLLSNNNNKRLYRITLFSAIL